MNHVEQLQRRIHAKTGLYGTWMPTDNVEIGDYGYLSRGKFNRMGNAKSKGIKFKADVKPATPSHFAFSDRATFESVGGAKLGVPGANAKLAITLHDSGAFVYQLRDIITRRIDDKQAFFKALFLAILSGNIVWPDNYLVIDEIRAAGPATILVLENDLGKLSVSGKGDLAQELNTPLANAEGEIRVQIERGSITQAVCEGQVTPLYHPIRLDFDPPGGPAGPMQAMLAWVRERFPDGSIQPDAIRFREYFPGEQKFAFQLKKTGEQFHTKASIVTIEEFLKMGREEDSMTATPMPEVRAEAQSDYVPRSMEAGG